MTWRDKSMTTIYYPLYSVNWNRWTHIIKRLFYLTWRQSSRKGEKGRPQGPTRIQFAVHFEPATILRPGGIRCCIFRNTDGFYSPGRAICLGLWEKSRVGNERCALGLTCSKMWRSESRRLLRQIRRHIDRAEIKHSQSDENPEESFCCSWLKRVSRDTH